MEGELLSQMCNHDCPVLSEKDPFFDFCYQKTILIFNISIERSN